MGYKSKKLRVLLKKIFPDLDRNIAIEKYRKDMQAFPKNANESIEGDDIKRYEEAIADSGAKWTLNPD